MRAGLVASDAPLARAGEEELRRRYRFVAPAEADVLVALGGDGFLLSLLHRLLDAERPVPVFGMNRGTVGFLMNDWSPDGLPERLAAARAVTLRPLAMTARSTRGETVSSPAFNEVSLLRETRQIAHVEIAIDGKVRMPELSCDGVLVATPAGSTAYNLSVGGPILPLDCDLLALTAISPFRPRRWRGALIPHRSVVEFRILEAERRPVSAVADQVEVRDVAWVQVATDFGRHLELLFDPEYALDDRILAEQFQG
ncbi:MAG: NAD kinase [Sphingomonadaceae bacterium]|uniref:NAD kinase n=1 Tax=Thermaurantiacus sp. TaxID=2820283 RepID=UPI00298F3796|nr:NAD kinase [Thermaurantiacus sp.]MCS6986175.1 NAD kinase [Sphingomonadaceae bacterium]MDW8414599.1 NAD kinase [Thermaurantiacus sp.]